MTYRRLSQTVTVFILFIALSACNNVPDHAKFIPKDAVAVVGINTKEIGKKVMWNALMGSKLVKNIQDKEKANALEGLENAGVKGYSTSYMYIKTDQRFTNGARVTALIPLDDAGKWEAYIKKTLPGTVIKDKNGRKEADLGHNMYAGWNEDLLIIMNTIKMEQEIDYSTMTDTSFMAGDSAGLQVHTAPIDETQVSAEMNNAFTISKENALTSNKRFTKLEQEAHDISIWVNYEILMGQYMGKAISGMTGGFALSNAMWKDAAMSAGFDFEKGSIDGDMHYYFSDELQQVARELGKENADKEMTDRLPMQNLDMLMTGHFSPKGIKLTLEKMGVLGFINLALSGQGLSTDDIFDAFTGDVALAMNDFTMKREAIATDDTTGAVEIAGTYKTDINYTYVIKINKKDKFKRLLQLAVENEFLDVTGTNTYSLHANAGGPAMVMDDKYFVIANTEAGANAYIQGKFKSQKPTPPVKVVYGHPFGFYFDIQAMMGAVAADVTATPHDAAMLAESRKLLRDISFTGGEFSNDALEYKMAINFMNKEENSLLLLLDFANRMDDASKQETTVFAK